MHELDQVTEALKAYIDRKIEEAQVSKSAGPALNDANHNGPIIRGRCASQFCSLRLERDHYHDIRLPADIGIQLRQGDGDRRTRGEIFSASGESCSISALTGCHCICEHRHAVIDNPAHDYGPAVIYGQALVSRQHHFCPDHSSPTR